MEKMGRRGERERRLEKERSRESREAVVTSSEEGQTERAGWGGGRRYAGL